AQHFDAAEHLLHVHHPRPQGSVRAAHRRGLAAQPENRAAHRLRHLLRQKHQHHLLQHPRRKRRLQQTFNCSPTSCPQLTFPNVIWTPPGGPLAAPFAGAVTPQVTNFAPPALTQASRGQTPDWVNPRVHEGDVTLEHQLPGGISASIAYVVSRGLHLPIFVDANVAPSTQTRTYDILT